MHITVHICAHIGGTMYNIRGFIGKLAMLLLSFVIFIGIIVGMAKLALIIMVGVVFIYISCGTIGHYIFVIERIEELEKQLRLPTDK